MGELYDIYVEMEVLLEEFRVEWAKDHAAGRGRKESYWQGKKDGLRVGMNLICALAQQELTEEE